MPAYEMYIRTKHGNIIGGGRNCEPKEEREGAGGAQAVQKLGTSCEQL